LRFILDFSCFAGFDFIAAFLENERGLRLTLLRMNFSENRQPLFGIMREGC
jgi:hypothetical protein